MCDDDTSDDLDLGLAGGTGSNIVGLLPRSIRIGESFLGSIRGINPRPGVSEAVDDGDSLWRLGGFRPVARRRRLVKPAAIEGL